MITSLLLTGFILSFVVAVVLTGTEITIGSISRDSIEKLIENNVRGASLLYRIISNKRRFQLMLLTGRIIAKVGGTLILFALMFNVSLSSGFNLSASGFIVFLLSTVVFVLAEGILARLITLGDYETTVSRFSYFLVALYVVLFPILYFLDTILSSLIKKSSELAAKEEALMEYVKSESEDGVIEKEEKDMIQDVLEFFDTTVREVMVPRIDIIAVETDISADDLIALFKKEGHSRIPVYEDRIDRIVGVVYAKDLLSMISEKGKDALNISEIMRKPYYVPETKDISILLKELKKAKVHIAIVVDEYGGTAGIVTLEDLLEEIVGDIQDEYDSDERDYHWLNDHMVQMDAGLSIDEVNEIIHGEILSDDFDTLGGFIYHHLGVIPKGGEEFKWENMTFTITEITGNRISKVIIKLDDALINNPNDMCD